ncbi:DUF2059 domain-containing protein [Kaistia algarum]|uniref:DUF2059 domain-containing protein n=1 Tax=Kaistia algarum TaxID=2083279 RepID=UPI0014026271|nr:DUF2059 domain-containing protein [Kaistia algarum]MCX5512119.1 DUF2059 domain-containing protein [Kaistia algarum]
MKLVRLAVVLFFTASALPAAHAVEPTIDEKVEYLLKGCATTDSEALFAAMAPSLKRDLSGQPPEAAARMLEIAKGLVALDFPDFRSKYLTFYRATFSDAEISAMYEFYTSPIGRQIVDKNKRVTAFESQAIADHFKGFSGKMWSAWAKDAELQAILRKPKNKS